MTQLNVWCLSGLGNRMRALLGGRELAERQGWEFSYTWDDRSGSLTARLGELWEQEFVEVSRLSAFLGRLPSREYLGADLRTWPVGAENRRKLSLKTGDYVFDRDGNKVDWGKQFRALRPSPEVAHRLDSVSREMGSGEFVGVMIRAHEASHPKTKQFSPVQWYEQRMRALLELQPDLRFYISSDVPEVADALISRFPTAMTQQNKGDYNTTAGTQSAVADLYMLAASSGVLRPFWSSFTTMASELSHQAQLLEDSQSELVLEASTLVHRASDVFQPWSRPTAL